MTPKQTAALRRITNRLAELNMDGNLAFTVEPQRDATDRLVLLHVSNVDGLPWFAKHLCGYVIVGERGGIRRVGGDVTVKRLRATIGEQKTFPYLCFKR